MTTAKTRTTTSNATPDFQSALLANITKRYCSLLREAAAHLWQFDFTHRLQMFLLTYLLTSYYCRCSTDHENWKTGAYHTSSPGAALVTSSTAHWLQASCSCAQGITRPASTVPDWRLSACDRHRPPITAIGWCLDVCHKRTRTRLGDRSFSVAGPCLWNCLPVALRDGDLTCTV